MQIQPSQRPHLKPLKPPITEGSALRYGSGAFLHRSALENDFLLSGWGFVVSPKARNTKFANSDSVASMDWLHHMGLAGRPLFIAFAPASVIRLEKSPADAGKKANCFFSPDCATQENLRGLISSSLVCFKSPNTTPKK